MCSPAGSLEHCVTPSTIVKSYRRPRRRPATLRTKTGCLTCLMRKTKCDEQKNTCRNCINSHRECVWRPHPSRDHEKRNSCSSGASSDTPGSPHSRDSTEGTQSPNAGTTSNLSKPKLITAASLETNRSLSSAVIPPSATPIFRYCVNIYLPQIVRESTNSEFARGVEEEIITVAFHHPFLMHALLAITASHMGRKFGGYSEVAATFYGQALIGLRQSLQVGEVDVGGNAFLMTGITLNIYESHNSTGRPPEGKPAHLIGVAKAIRLRSSSNPSYYDLNQTQTQVAMQRMILESFLFHASRSPLFEGGETESEDIVAAVWIVDQICDSIGRMDVPGWQHSPVLGAPTNLFYTVYEICRLYRKSALEEHDISLCIDLEMRLLSWSLLFHDEKHPDNTTPSDVRPPYEVHDKSFHQLGHSTYHKASAQQDELLGIDLYIAVGMIALKRLMGFATFSLDESTEVLISKASALINGGSNTSDYDLQYYSWPLAAIKTLVSSQDDQ